MPCGYKSFRTAIANTFYLAGGSAVALHLGHRVSVTLLDIALMKLIAIAQRGAKRDFVDLYFICQHGYSLEYLLTRLSEKYPEVPYPSSHLLRALTYFDDADADVSPQVLVPYDWSQVKLFFQTEVPILIKKFFQS